MIQKLFLNKIKIDTLFLNLKNEKIIFFIFLNFIKNHIICKKLIN